MPAQPFDCLLQHRDLLIDLGVSHRGSLSQLENFFVADSG
jgi:hypothetical protein